MDNVISGGIWRRLKRDRDIGRKAVLSDVKTAFTLTPALNQDLSSINLWLIANKLTLNMTKTEFMLIGSRQKLNSLSAIPALEINETQLNRVNFTKSLGVLIDENLTWSNHINALV